MIKEAHNPEVAGSNPAPATIKTRLIDGFFVYRHLGLSVLNIETGWIYTFLIGH